MRIVGPACRQCRREEVKLFLKGERCYTEKCGVERRAYPPGQHGQTKKRKSSAYGDQLREKQKVKRIYGVSENQFRGYYHRAVRMKGISGQNLLILLERRLDNVVYRMGLAANHPEARQLVRHGHVLVNGKRIDIPSFLVRLGDQIQLKETSKQMPKIIERIEASEKRGMPSWLLFDKDNFRGQVKSMPSRDDLTMPIQEQLIIELYSK